MARPRHDATRAATPERLLDAAESEFARRGLAAARLSDIARQAGITRPSLLHHYASKEALYVAVVERSFRALGAELGRVMTGRRGLAVHLRGLVQGFSHFLSRRPALAGVILRELIEEAGPGRGILLKQVAPLVTRVERFLRGRGRGQMAPGLPLRAALMQTAADVLLQAAAGPLRGPLWGPRERTWELARRLFLVRSAEVRP